MPEVHRDKTRRKYGVRSRWFSKSSPRLPGFEIVARCFVVRLYVLEQLGDELQLFWKRFAGSLKQGQPRICAGKKSCYQERLEAT